MLDKKTYFIRQHTKFIRSSKTYDIIDPDTQEHVAIAQEKISMFMVFLRLLINKMLLPMRVNVYAGNTLKDNNNILFSIRKGVTFLSSKVVVYNENNEMIGWFKTKAFSFKIAIRVFDRSDNEVALIKGDWKGWNFKFTDKEDNEIGLVTKKWAGIGKELFTQSDNYVISLTGEPNHEQATLLLAAGLSIDLIYKSGK